MSSVFYPGPTPLGVVLTIEESLQRCLRASRPRRLRAYAELRETLERAHALRNDPLIESSAEPSLSAALVKVDRMFRGVESMLNDVRMSADLTGEALDAALARWQMVSTTEGLTMSEQQQVVAVPADPMRPVAVEVLLARGTTAITGQGHRLALVPQWLYEVLFSLDYNVELLTSELPELLDAPGALMSEIETALVLWDPEDHRSTYRTLAAALQAAREL